MKYRVLPLEELLNVIKSLEVDLYKVEDRDGYIYDEIKEITELEYTLWPEGVDASEVFDENGSPIVGRRGPKQIQGHSGKYSNWANIRDGEGGLKRLQSKRLSFLIDQIDTSKKIDSLFVKKMIELTEYFHHEVRDKASTFLKENYKDELINQFCDVVLNTSIDDDLANEAIDKLNGLKLSPADLKTIAPLLADKILAVLKKHIGAEDSDEDNMFPITLVLGNMLAAFPKESAVLQDNILDFTSTISSYEDFELMCFTLRNNKDAFTYWDQDNVIVFGNQIADITKKEFRKGDAFGENDLKPTLEMIATVIDIPKVKETLSWIDNN